MGKGMNNAQKDQQHEVVGLTAASGLNNSTLAASEGREAKKISSPTT